MPKAIEEELRKAAIRLAKKKQDEKKKDGIDEAKEKFFIKLTMGEMK